MLPTCNNESEDSSGNCYLALGHDSDHESRNANGEAVRWPVVKEEVEWQMFL